MTSVVPDGVLRLESGAQAAERPTLAPDPAATPYPPSDVRWLRRLSRRLALLDALVVTASVALALGIVFGPTDRRISIVGELEHLTLTSYLLLGPALAVAWSLSLR